MMTLCGFSASNYYNKVKLALLEKGVAFEEREVWTDQVDKATSPLGKVPYLLTPMGALSESTVILDYLEQQFTEVPLVPADPFGAAKVRELATYIDLHLELVVRNLYPEAFFGRTVSDATKETVSKTIKKNVAAFASLAKFEPLSRALFSRWQTAQPLFIYRWFRVQPRSFTVKTYWLIYQSGTTSKGFQCAQRFPKSAQTVKRIPR